MEVCSAYFDPEYDTLNENIYGPRVSVDNEYCKTCTVVKVDSLDKQGLLLEVVQVLTDVDLVITKGYISCDAGWFMDVFHVKDQLGKKVTDKHVIGYIQRAIGARRELQNSIEAKNSNKDAIQNEPSSECTAIEMIGVNRPGLFSEISAVLAEQRCNVIEAHAWSHNACLACVAYISDESTSTCINDPSRLSSIKDHLSIVLGPSASTDDDCRCVKTHGLGCDSLMSRTERRLHQLMLANHDFDGPSRPVNASYPSLRRNNYEQQNKTVVSINQCFEKGYSVVNVECVDRPRLLFDTVCTLTDMQYTVFHASVSSHGPYAHQEYFIRRKDGCILDRANEAKWVAKCLEAAIERRVCQGVRLELDAQIGALPYVTRTLREYGLTVARADIAAHGEKTKNIFYIQDISGKEVDMGIVESMKKELQPFAFKVKNEVLPDKCNNAVSDGSTFVSLLKSKFERISRNFVST